MVLDSLTKTVDLPWPINLNGRGNKLESNIDEYGKTS